MTLRNFRGFRDLRGVALRPLTFVVGPNSSGKSTLGAAVMFLAQSEYLGFDAVAPVWTGRLVDLGSYQDTVYGHEKGRKILISVTLSALRPQFYSRGAFRARGSEFPDLRISATLRSSAHPSGALAELLHDSPTVATVARVTRRPGRHASYEIAFLKRRLVWTPLPNDRWRPLWTPLHYLMRSTRQHTRRSNRAARRRLSVFKDVVSSAHWFSEGVQRVPSARLAPRRWYDRGVPQEHNIDREALWDRVEPRHFTHERYGKSQSGTHDWLQRMGICQDLYTDDFSAYHTAIRVTDFVTGVDANLIDVGFGVSQVFPVVRSAMSGRRGLLYLEQPEAHLHPAAQAELGELLARASANRQILVETHSEHLINRARVLVARGELEPSDLTILYVSRDASGSKVTEIFVDERGNFTRDWPSGFFDERYKETMTLSALQQRMDDDGRRS